MRHGRLRLVLSLGVLVAAVTGCASVGASTTSAVPDERSPIAAVPGCERAWTDPADDSPTRTVARCAPGTPAPQPLSHPATVVVSIPVRLEYAAPLLLADSLGEFAKENITIRYVGLPSYDAIPQLSQGQIDAAVAGYELALFNAERLGLDVEAVMGNYFPPDAGDYSVPQTGLWCRRSSFSNPADPDPAETQDMKWGIATGKGTVSFYYSVAELARRVPDFDPHRVRIEALMPNEAAIALGNGAVDCASLIDPLWVDFVTSDYVQMATQTPGEPLGMTLFGKNLIDDSPAVGDAFVRAVVRTINTYLAGDYHSDPKVMDALAVAMNMPVEKIARTPSLRFDWELRSGTPDRVQQLFLDLHVISGYEHLVPEEELIDRSFTEHAVGRTN